MQSNVFERPGESQEASDGKKNIRLLLEVFLAVAEFVGFRAGGRIPFE